jgi:hypothetical protein
VPRARLTVSAVVLVLAVALSIVGCQNGPTTTSASATTTSTAAPQAESMAPVPAAFQRCTDCHEDLDAFLAASKTLNPGFGHLGHLSQGYTCGSCHVAPPHPAEGEVVLPPMLSCFSCHGQTATPSASAACLSCHPLGFPMVPADRLLQHVPCGAFLRGLPRSQRDHHGDWADHNLHVRPLVLSPHPLPGLLLLAPVESGIRLP